MAKAKKYKMISDNRIFYKEVVQFRRKKELFDFQHTVRIVIPASTQIAANFLFCQVTMKVHQQNR